MIINFDYFAIVLDKRMNDHLSNSNSFLLVTIYGWFNNIIVKYVVYVNYYDH